MNFRTIKQETKDALVGNRFMIFLVILVNYSIAGALSYLGVGIIMSPILALGVFLIIKVMMKERRVDFNLLFHYFKDLNHAAKILGVYFLTLLITIVGFIFLIIPGIIFALRYSQALYIIADNPDMFISEAMKKSKELMVGHKGELFVFHLSFIGHYILIGLTFGLYGIYALPYIQGAIVNYYLHLTNQDGENLIVYKEEEPVRPF